MYIVMTYKLCSTLTPCCQVGVGSRSINKSSKPYNFGNEIQIRHVKLVRWNPVSIASESNRLHVEIFQYFFIDLRYIL
jgi:hypothetical protein